MRLPSSQAIVSLGQISALACGPAAALALAGDPVQAGSVVAGGVMAFLAERLGKTADEIDRKSVRLQIANHPLTRLADLALEEAIREFRREHDVAAWDEALVGLESRCDGFHRRGAESVTGSANLARVAHVGSESRERPEVAEAEDGEGIAWRPRSPEWPSLVDELAAGEVLVKDFRDELARHLSHRVPAMATGLLREDAAGRGPLEGTAWPAVQIRWQHDMRFLVAGILDRLDDQRETADTLRRELAERFAFDATRIERLEAALREQERSHVATLRRRIELLTRDQLERHEELIDAVTVGDARLMETLEHVRARLESTARLIEHLSRHGEVLAKASLESLDAFSERMWLEWEAKTDVGGFAAEKLEILRRGPKGRDLELAEFEAFLADDGARVLYWKGWPGAGKTRLCLEMGERAQSRGWVPLYASDRVNTNPIPHLAATLETCPPGGAFLVFLDTSNRGLDRELVRRFYDLPQDHRAHAVKCVCTSWPNYAELFAEPFKQHPWFRGRELGPVAADGPFRDLLVELGDGVVDAEEASRLIEAAEGTPLVAFLGLQQRIAEPEAKEFETRHQILDGNYLQLIHDFLVAHRESTEPLLWALRTMAMIRSVDRTDEHLAECLRSSPNGDLTTAIQTLAASGLLQRSGDRLDLSPDLFRIFVAKESCGAGTSERLRLFGGLAEWIDHASAFFGPSLAAIWSLTRQAVPERADELRDEILAAVDRRLKTIEDDPGARHLAAGLFEGTVVEPDASRCVDLADRIASLRLAHETEEIALAEAKALYNATVGEPDASRRVDLADRIGSLRLAHDTEEIALEEAKALMNATVVEPDASRRVDLADRFGDLLVGYSGLYQALRDVLAQHEVTDAGLEEKVPELFRILQQHAEDE